MTAAHLDAAASVPRARSSRPAGTATDAAGVRRRLKRWLGQLADMGVQLAIRVRDCRANRRAQDGAAGTPAPMAAGPGRIDLTLARDLVARALRWTGALCDRLAAEVAAAKAALKLENRAREPAERLDDWTERDDDASWIDSTLRRMRPPAEAPAPDPCIDGLPTGEVVEQICIDLGIVAVLFRSAALGEQIAAVAAEAHALLGGAGQPWTAPPIPPAEHPAADEQQAKWQNIGRQILAAVIAPVAAPVAVPDTG
jgi:hypothetical protein